MTEKALEISKDVAAWKERFDMLQIMRSGKGGAELQAKRVAALERFVNTGFPTTRHEEWKYTSIKPILNEDYVPVLNSVTNSSVSVPESIDIPGLKCNKLVFINGFYSGNHSEIIDEEEKIIIGNIGQESEKASLKVNSILSGEANAFSELNTAFADDGAYIHIPSNCTLEHPIHLVYISDATTQPTASFSRNIIIAGTSSQFRVIESRHTIGTNASLSNIFSEFFIGKNANVDYYVLENDNNNASLIHRTEALQEQDSVFHAFVITTGGKIVRNDLNVRHNGENCETRMSGIYLLTGTEHVDNHTLVDHALPNCNSNEIYKGVIGGNATAVFNGKVMVRQDAQKTNAFQSNKTILLSDTATINTKPQLEIFADDVKCSHGATTGQLDETALFYLMARGVPKKTAKQLLTIAFANEVLENVRIPELSEWLESLIRTTMEEYVHD